MTTTQNPEITGTRHDDSIDGIVVELDWTTTTVHGDPVQVLRFYENGPFITAEGCRIKKDGTPAARVQVVAVKAPANVREAMGR